MILTFGPHLWSLPNKSRVLLERSSIGNQPKQDYLKRDFAHVPSATYSLRLELFTWISLSPAEDGIRSSIRSKSSLWNRFELIINEVCCNFLIFNFHSLISRPLQRLIEDLRLARWPLGPFSGLHWSVRTRGPFPPTLNRESSWIRKLKPIELNAIDACETSTENSMNKKEICCLSQWTLVDSLSHLKRVRKS